MAKYFLKMPKLTIGVEGDLNSLDLQLQKQVLELVALIGTTLQSRF